jgi:hypothetical protein
MHPFAYQPLELVQAVILAVRRVVLSSNRSVRPP